MTKEHDRLNKLIEEYGRRTLFAGYDMTKDKTLLNNLNKSKQAIIDCVEKEKQEALKPIREVYNDYMSGIFSGGKEKYLQGNYHFERLWQAIKTTLGKK